MQKWDSLANLLSNEAVGLLGKGELVRARSVAAESRELWRRLGASREWAIATMILGWVELEEGHGAAALELGLASRGELARTEPLSFWTLGETLLGQACLALGHPERAAGFFEAASEVACSGQGPGEAMAGLALARLVSGDRWGCEALITSLTGQVAELVASAMAGMAIPTQEEERFQVRALVRAAQRFVAPQSKALLRFERAARGCVRLELQRGGCLTDLGYRRPWELLWVLALKGQRDAGLPEHEQGWLQLEDLAHRADIEPSQVDTYISRARAALAKVGIEEIVVARRGERRLGIEPARISLKGHRPGAGADRRH